MNFPTEEALISLALILVLVSMVTCAPKERQQCNIIHENAPHLQKCEIW